MFISKKLKEYLKQNTEYLIKQNKLQKLINEEIIKKINEIQTPKEKHDFEKIFMENK